MHCRLLRCSPSSTAPASLLAAATATVPPVVRGCRGLHQLNPFDAGFLQRRTANHIPLTPLSFLQRSVELYPNRIAGVHGNDHNFRLTWKQLNGRVSRLASGLVRAFNLKTKDVVSVISGNTPEAYEAHFSVPGVGLILHTMNTRLDAVTVAHQLKHSSSRVVLVDTEFSGLMSEVKALLEEERHPLPAFVAIHDSGYEDRAPEPAGLYVMTYEDLLSSGDEGFELRLPKDEWEAIALNYTSGTTGNPKGVVVHHRGAYLNALSHIVEGHMQRNAKYLWIVPMFHCNGWCFPWTTAALAGTNFFLRQVRPPLVFDLISRHGIEFMGGAPIVMNMLLDSPNRIKFLHPVQMWAGGSPPPESVVRRMKDELNVHVRTVYGLTEVMGCVTTHTPCGAEDARPAAEHTAVSRLMVQARDTVLEDVRVLDPQTYRRVPDDGQTLGEVMIRGNVAMKGYLNNPAATEEAFANGWFHTGDLAVSHGQGRFELKDRSKDVIISGGENISSIEVENVLHNHPDVREVAVIAMPHEKWGEVPAAFIALAPHSPDRDEQRMIAWCRDHLPHYMAPKRIVFMDSLPKTGTGKVQKHELRRRLVAEPKAKTAQPVAAG